MTEAEIQINVVMNYLYPLQKKNPTFEFFSIPNEAALQNSGGKTQRHRINIAGKLKKMGLKTGIPDLCFLLKGGKVFFIEMKAGKGVLSENQKFRIPIIEGLGFDVHICRSLEDVKNVMKNHGL